MLSYIAQITRNASTNKPLEGKGGYLTLKIEFDFFYE